jgi:hypothetical protein
MIGPSFPFTYFCKAFIQELNYYRLKARVFLPIPEGDNKGLLRNAKGGDKNNSSQISVL